MSIHDFLKLANAKPLHACFRARKALLKNKDSIYDYLQEFIKNAHTILQKIDSEYDKNKPLNDKIITLFALNLYAGEFSPLAAFIGGFTAQEVVKAITGKFVPLR
jgi:ubiquitin-activating enzyme E1